MMVPRARLLWWVALVGVPLGAVATAVPESSPLMFGLLAGLFLVALLDLVLAWGGLDGVTVIAPATVRLSDGLSGTLALELETDRPRTRALRVGLVTPPSLALEREETTADLPTTAQRTAIEWPCRPSRRGRYPLGPCVIGEASPLGFWDLRREIALSSEARVYPSLFRDRRHLAALFLDRGPFGAHARRQVGRGREFEKLREYVPGDPTEDIHWKATARRHRPITKLYQVERTQEVYVAIDTSRLSGRAAAYDSDGAPSTILDRYITAALVLELAAERQGDRFGLLAFGDGVDRFVRAASGPLQHRVRREALAGLEVELVSPDFDELCGFLRTRVTRRSLIIVLTSLDDPVLGEAFERAVELIARKHLILVNMLRPELARPLFSPGGEVRNTDDVYRHLGGHLMWSELRELQTRLGRFGVRLRQMDDARLAHELVSHYLAVKRRQLL